MAFEKPLARGSATLSESRLSEGVAKRVPALAPPRLIVDHGCMNQPQPPKIQLINGPDYREGYANSVQIRVNLWDFFLLFGLVNQT